MEFSLWQGNLSRLLELTDPVVIIQVPLVASNRIGKEVIKTEHGNSEITFYGNSFIAGMLFNISFCRIQTILRAQFNALCCNLDLVMNRAYRRNCVTCQ